MKKLAELDVNPYLAFEKDFLRWMLSDGAASFLLENKKNESGLSMRIDWIEGFSFANEAATCMYMGSDKTADGSLKSFMDYTPIEIYEQSILSVKQDVKLLGENIVHLGFKKLALMFQKHNFTPDEVTFFLPHMSSYFFEDKIYQALVEYNIEIPKERWFSNLATVGNVGAGSIYLMVDELFTSGRLKKGDKLLLAIPESARFSYVFSLLTVC
jgi:3-oxoacyl-[acyl-carrier-protein] synthase-3